MAHQALYRRYRPQRFAEVRGQEPVVRALRNAAAEDRVSHAYLFSGPRGTGKTSTARILAKVLNCEHVVDGEPCGECESCRAIEAGTSMDVHELDAASNNGVEAVRDLISRAAIGTPGRTKVYILDEVHMLSTAASNALLKTLEEPPGHVVFILATTDPQKVLPTIKSRTQHLPFNLIDADELAEHLTWLVGDAGLDVTDEALRQVLREGAGSARDTLSALDRVAAGGGVAEGTESVDALVEALADHDTGAALVAVADDVRRGRDPRLVGETLLGRLRDVFLASMHAELVHLPDGDREAVAAYAGRISAPALTRALEVLGEALVEMRQAPDPRIPLEVALVRLTRVDSDTSVAALAERLERLERGGVVAAALPTPTAAPDAPGGTAAVDEAPAAPVGTGSPGDAARALLKKAERSAGVSSAQPAPRVAAPPLPAPEAQATPAPSTTGSSAPRPALGARRGQAPAAAAPAAAPTDPAPTPDAPAGTTPAAAGGLPDLGAILAVWDDQLLAKLPPAAKARFRGGRFARTDGAAAVFALPNDMHRQRCEEYRRDVEAVLAEHFGSPVPLTLVVDADVVEAGLPGGDAPAPEPGAAPTAAEPVANAAPTIADEDDDEAIDPDELVDAVGEDRSAVQRLEEAFGPVEVIEEETT
ncbi:MAG TPA: DNA polymerase III subunit gamma/tau [Acidimicrobiales bacterium]|nr:DNA polymerase III subunit gamma/tau [Acidimicrobiales bacterium]